MNGPWRETDEELQRQAAVNLIAMEAASKYQAREQSKTLETIQQDQKLLIVANKDIKKEIQDMKQNYGDMNIDLQSTKKKITGISVTVDRLTQQVNQLRQEKIQQQIVITAWLSC
jgi:archaellum component FlaC